jgi:hypothetical protein
LFMKSVGVTMFKLMALLKLTTFTNEIQRLSLFKNRTMKRTFG